MDRQKDHRRHLAGHEQMPQRGPGVGVAGWTVTAFIEPAVVIREACILDVEIAGRGEDLAGTRRPCRQDAVEKVDPAGDSVQHVLRVSHTHEIPWAVRGQQRRRHLDRLIELLTVLSHRESADSEAVKWMLGKLFRAAPPQPL